MAVWLVSIRREGYEALPFTGSELKEALTFNAENGSILIQVEGSQYEVLGIIRKYTL
jgi:hypothetical protein